MAEPTSKLSYWDYVKAAFNVRPRLKGLGHIPFNKVMLIGFAILGFGHPGFWLLGTAAEAAYIYALSTNKRFQNFTRASLRESSYHEWWRKAEDLYQRLDGQNQVRFRRLEEKCRELIKLGEDWQHADSSLVQMKSSGINQMLLIFLKLLSTKQLLAANLRALDRQKLLEEIRQIELQVERGKGGEAMRKSLESTMEIKKKRLTNLEQALNNLQVIEIELQRIEEQLQLLREEAIVKRDPQFLSDQLDSVSSTLIDTVSWMDRQEELFRSIDEAKLEPPPKLIREGD